MGNKAEMLGHAAEVAGLGILAAPHLKHLATGKEPSKKATRNTELAGLGVLAAPSVYHLVKRGSVETTMMQAFSNELEKIAETEIERARKWGRGGAITGGALGAASHLAHGLPLGIGGAAVGSALSAGVGYGIGRGVHRANFGKATNKKVKEKKAGAFDRAARLAGQAKGLVAKAPAALKMPGSMIRGKPMTGTPMGHIASGASIRGAGPKIPKVG